MKWLASLLIVLLATAPVRATELPRYHLPVGRVLHYVSGSKFQLLVLSQNPDGSSRMLQRTDDAVPRFMALFDLFPDGRVLADPQDLNGQIVGNLFPRLPADAAQMAGSWQNDVVWTHDHVSYSAQPGTDTDFVFKATSESPLLKVIQSALEETLHFDTARGIVTLAEIQVGKNPAMRHQMRIRFDREETMDGAKLASLSHDYPLYFEAKRRYATQMNIAMKHPADAEKIVDSAGALLAGAEQQLSDPDVIAELKAKLKDHPRAAIARVKEAHALIPLLNKQMPDWTAKDLDGKPYSAAQLRGKIVVMDFWYRQCIYCIWAMPQVHELVAKYKDKGVVFLGMNTDKEIADARFAVKELGMDYPQIQARELADRFAVEGFPTLIVIDADGIVREFHPGYSKDLARDVSAKLDDMMQGTR